MTRWTIKTHLLQEFPHLPLYSIVFALFSQCHFLSPFYFSFCNITLKRSFLFDFTVLIDINWFCMINIIFFYSVWLFYSLRLSQGRLGYNWPWWAQAGQSFLQFIQSQVATDFRDKPKQIFFHKQQKFFIKFTEFCQIRTFSILLF